MPHRRWSRLSRRGTRAARTLHYNDIESPPRSYHWRSEMSRAKCPELQSLTTTSHDLPARGRTRGVYWFSRTSTRPPCWWEWWTDRWSSTRMWAKRSCTRPIQPSAPSQAIRGKYAPDVSLQGRKTYFRSKIYTIQFEWSDRIRTKRKPLSVPTVQTAAESQRWFAFSSLMTSPTSERKLRSGRCFRLSRTLQPLPTTAWLFGTRKMRRLFPRCKTWFHLWVENVFFHPVKKISANSTGALSIQVLVTRQRFQLQK